MPNDLSGFKAVRFDMDRDSTYEFTFSDLHEDTESNTELFENDADTRGDDYFTGSFADPTLVLPSVVDDSGTDQFSTLEQAMVDDDYIRVEIEKFNGKTLVLDRTKIKIRQITESQVGNLDAFEIQLRDVDTSGIFRFS